MTLTRIIFTSLTLLLFNLNSFSQDKIIQNHYHQFDVKENHVHFGKYASDKTEIERLVSGMFLFYKAFISSQDANSCVFHPSCSVYAIESIKTLGPIKGLMNAFDRLSRCHGLATQEYKIHQETNLLYDPINEE